MQSLNDVEAFIATTLQMAVWPPNGGTSNSWLVAPGRDHRLPLAGQQEPRSGNVSSLSIQKRSDDRGGTVVDSYRPMTLADLASHLTRAGDDRTRWKLVWEFLEEYRWEPTDIQPTLLRDEPPPVGDERWDVLLAALAEHLAAQHDLAPPPWAEMRVLQWPWFPAELRVQRADALVRAPAAFRKHGVYLSAADLQAA
jgi:hypothetical protein